MTPSPPFSDSVSVRSVSQPDWLASVTSSPSDAHSFLDEMIRRPYRFDFFQAVRRIESLTPFLPRVGWATRADQELIRIGQSVHLDFAPATIEEVSWTDAGRLRMLQRFFGLWGPSGALPLPMTESARDQWRHEKDRTQIAFADIFHHRMATLLYRVWSTSRGAIQRDRPEEDRFADHVASLAGNHVPRKPRTSWKPHSPAIDTASKPSTDSSDVNEETVSVATCEVTSSVTDLRRFHAARFGIRRNANGLQDLLAGAFGVTVNVRTFVPSSLQLREEDRACLSRRGDRHPPRGALGGGLVLGRRIEDHASTIELRIGPLDLNTYRSFMPGGEGHVALSRLARGYAGRGLQIQVRLILRRSQTPAMRLGMSSTIGRDTWLTAEGSGRDPDDYRFYL